MLLMQQVVAVAKSDVTWVVGAVLQLVRIPPITRRSHHFVWSVSSSNNKIARLLTPVINSGQHTTPITVRRLMQRVTHELVAHARNATPPIGNRSHRVVSHSRRTNEMLNPNPLLLKRRQAPIRLAPLAPVWLLQPLKSADLATGATTKPSALRRCSRTPMRHLPTSGPLPLTIEVGAPSLSFLPPLLVVRAAITQKICSSSASAAMAPAEAVSSPTWPIAPSVNNAMLSVMPQVPDPSRILGSYDE